MAPRACWARVCGGVSTLRWLRAMAAAIPALVPAVALAQPQPAQPVRGWAAEPLPKLTTPRAAHQALRLANGALWVMGGCSAASCAALQASAEVLAPGARAFRAAGTLTTQRVSHRAVALWGERVLVLGGWDGRQDLASAEVWDAATQRATPIAAMHAARQQPVAVPLADGSVLVAGGGGQGRGALASAERFDARTRRFTPLPDMNSARTHHSGVRLKDGRVLLAGGLDARGSALASAELFDPATGRFSATGAMTTPRYKHAAVALADGRVLVLGGSQGGDERGLLASTEIWDPANGRFSPGPPLRHARYKFEGAVLAVAGGVLVGGGARQPEWWDGRARAFTPLPIDLGATWAFATLTAGSGDEALLVGGYDDATTPTARAWRLRPLRAAPAASRAAHSPGPK